MSVPSHRAVGVVRQSNSRDDSQSPEQQAERIRDECRRRGFELTTIHTELDVSGGRPLSRRPGLRAAVEAVEAGQAGIVIGAYFDRLIRSLKVQAELVERVEAAGGQVLALDTGQVTNGSAGQWLSSTMLGAVAEYHRRTTGERVRESQRAAIERGAVPFPGHWPGYDRGTGATPLSVNQAEAEIVAQGFELRAQGQPISAVHRFWNEHGIDLNYWGTQRYLANRIVLGELHFGDLHNPRAHTAIVSTGLFDRAQKVKVSRGRQAKSQRLLARLGVLLCGTCESRMTVNTATTSKAQPFYVCKRHACPRHVTISADKVEQQVWDAVIAKAEGEEGVASAERKARRAQERLELEQQRLDALIEVLDPLEPASRRRLGEQTAVRDEAFRAAERLGIGTAHVRRVRASDPNLTLTERRALVRATVASVKVAPGRGSNRLAFEFFGE